ncbi:MAG TPA: hypothetical protein VF756_14120 [Thermoanaerobaculia bacterium]
MDQFKRLEQWYRRITWFGLFLNVLFIVPLYLAPQFALNLLNITAEPDLWARISGMLLLTISVFYIPATMDLRKYWVYAWIAIVPSRLQGSLFFFIAVLVFGYPYGYLPIAFVDGGILLMQLVVLLKARKVLAAEKASPVAVPKRSVA